MKKLFLALLLITFACAKPVSRSATLDAPVLGTGRLRGVNWYGASDSHYVVGGLDKNTVANIVSLIKQLGFNSVRLPFSNEMIHVSTVADKWVSANPDLVGKKPLQVYDAVVEALTSQGVYVILNNHTTTAKWCCGWDENALWFDSDQTTAAWEADWLLMVKRYKDNALVIGADLRNEIRQNSLGEANWGTNDAFDWHNVSEEVGAKILEASPNLTVIVEGTKWATNLTGVAKDPVRLPKDHLIYSSHAYDSNPTKTTPQEVRFKDWDERFGFLAEESIARLWVGEFGAAPSDDHEWLTQFFHYIQERHLDWCVWPLNSGPKASGEIEYWGLLTPDWKAPVSDWRTQLMLGK